MLKSPALCAALAALAALAASAPGRHPADPPAGVGAGAPEEVVVFAAGKDGYASFRIPAVVAGAKGTLLAFAEGRKDGPSDDGNVDTVLRRSTDGGKTWGPLRVVADAGADFVGNPCPVLDRTTGRVWLPLARKPGRNTAAQSKTGGGAGPMEVLMLHSDDDGATWSPPENVTKAVKPDGWTWYVVGPGCGIQLADGRLVLPCDHRKAGSTDSFSHVIVSDDHGKTWRVGGSAAAKTNECQVAERADGALVLNMRSHHGKNRRAVAVSTDRGATWGETTFDDALIDPTCQGSLIRVDVKTGGGPLFLFSNPASTKRENLTVRLSRDGGRTWPAARVLHPRAAGYSSLVALPDDRAGCLYEKDGYATIAFARFGLGWLAAGRETPGK